MGGGGGPGGSGWGVQGGCEQRIEVFVKIQKKKKIVGGGSGCRVGGGRVGGVRVDVNEELKFLGKCKKKKNWGGGGGQDGLGRGAGCRTGGTGFWGLGGQGGCE